MKDLLPQAVLHFGSEGISLPSHWPGLFHTGFLGCKGGGGKACVGLPLSIVEEGKGELGYGWFGGG